MLWLIVTLQKYVRYKECKVRWNRQVKEKKPAKFHCASQKFVATILVTYVTILTEPNLSLQN